LKTALITVGSTREYIDPVRYITNESSGQQGMALIKSLIKNNFKVICLHGYLQVKPLISKKISYIFTPNAEKMLKAAKKYKKVDLAIFNAAVADYRVENYQKQKIKRDKNLTLKLKNNPDILKTISNINAGPQITVGFAYETNDVKANALKKLKKKNCDFLVLNYPISKNIIFNNKYTNGGIFNKKGHYYSIGNVTKTSFANQVLRHILKAENE
jgi:phosphopantothenoylcysteine decarboxylase/phosphopantothenate--cysteine ligase